MSEVRYTRIKILAYDRDTGEYREVFRISMKEERKEMFYLTMHSTHFILRLYGIRHMVTDHRDRERGNCCLMGYSF